MSAMESCRKPKSASNIIPYIICPRKDSKFRYYTENKKLSTKIYHKVLKIKIIVVYLQPAKM